MGTTYTPSPGGWTAPAGVIPGWNWMPTGHGLSPRFDRVPRWVHFWYRTPFLDRYAHAWMWHHGGWDVQGWESEEPGNGAGVREPRRPSPVRPRVSIEHRQARNP